MSWFSQDFPFEQNNFAPMSKSRSPEAVPILDTEPSNVGSTENHSIPSPPRVAASNCAGCYRRKIKCDRQLDGCFNCSKANVKCTYPRQEHTVRQKRGPYHKDPSKKKNSGFEQKILALEEKLKDLSEKLQNGKKKGFGITNNSGSPREQSSCEGTFCSDFPPTNRNESPIRKRKAPRIYGESDLSLDCSLWSDFGSRTDDAVTQLDSTIDDDKKGSSSASSITADFLLRSNPESPSLRHLHPPPHTIYDYWHLYKERVDPMTKILHVPSFQKTLFEAIDNLQGISAGLEALMFSIYYAAINSMSDIDCQSCESKDVLLEKFGNACKLAFSNVNLLCSQDMVALQALTIFLISNFQDDFQLVYTLTGVAVRMAQSLGLCQDGAILPISPFEVEMRRRLWWNIYRLERRAVENYNMHSFAIEHRFDTHLPSNIDDADICPEDTKFPPAKVGRTEMTYTLVDVELALLTFGVRDEPPSSGLDEYKGARSIKSLHDKQRMVRKCHQRLTSTHLQYCNPSSDLDFMVLSWANLNLTRIWLSIHQPSPLHLQFALPHLYHPDKTSDHLLLLTLDTINHVQILQKDSRMSKWTWSFSSATKLHLASFLLTELCHRPQGALGERAWKTVDEIFGENELWDGDKKDLPSSFQARLAKLFAQMMANRQKDLGLGRGSRQVQWPVSAGAESISHQDSWNINYTPVATPLTRPPHSPLKRASTPRGFHFSDSGDGFSPGSSNRTSQINLHSLSSLSSGHHDQAKFGSSRSMIFDHTRDLSTWGFLTPTDSMDILEAPLPSAEGNKMGCTGGDDFLGGEWDETWMRSVELENQEEN